MAAQDYGIYDRILDWCSDHRMAFAKAFVLVAVVAMVGGILLVIVAQL